MKAAAARYVSRGLFGVRLIIFFLIPFTGYVPMMSLMLLVVLLLTWLIDYRLGNTLWFSARAKTYALQIIFLAALLIVFWRFPLQQSGLPLVAPLLMLAFNSDAISNSRRYQFLLPAMVAGWCVAFVLPRLDPPTPGFASAVPYTLLLYSLLPGIACLARLFFPRTKDLLHTSLDYPPFRVEILSYGMKRPAAVGIKRV